MDPGSDIQTDAQRESNDISLALPETSGHNDLSSAQSSGVFSSYKMAEREISTCYLPLMQSARPISPPDDKEYLKYLSHMPERLQEDNIDILIINSEKDRKAAASFKNHLKKDIVFYIHDYPRSPRVKLLYEIRCGSEDPLDFAFTKALYVFLYVTKEFCEDFSTVFRGHACLTESIRDPDKRWCVVPVHTTPKRNQTYRLPLMLNCLRPINYFTGRQDQFYMEGVRKLLESKIGLLLENDRKLDEERQECFRKNRSEYLKNARYACMASSLAPSSLPVAPISNTEMEQSSLPISSKAVFQTGVHRDSPQSDHHCDKAVPEMVAAAVIDGMEGLAVSEEEPLPEKYSLLVNIKNSTSSSREQANQQEPQQPELLDIHSSSSSVKPLQDGTTLTTNNNNNSESTQQVALITNDVSASEEESSVVVDGPVYEPYLLSLEQQNVVPHSDQHKTISNRASSPAQVSSVSCTPAEGGQDVSPTARQSTYPTSYCTPGPMPYIIDSTGRPFFRPWYHPFIPPHLHNSVSDPHFSQCPPQHYPSLPPFDMEALYSYANPIPCQPVYFQNPMGPRSEIYESTSEIEDSQLSTEANAPNSLRSGLSHSLSAGTLDSFSSSPRMNNQNPVSQQFPTWSSALFLPQPWSYITSHHPASCHLSRQQVETAPTNFVRHQQPHIQSLGGQRDLGVGSRPSATTMPSLANSPETSGRASIMANSAIQHIHHHHHHKKIVVEQATNVLIGDKSKFMTKNTSSDVVDDADESENGGDSCAEDDRESSQSGTPVSSRVGRHSSTTRNTAANESQRSRSEDSGNASAGSQQNLEASMGFAECLSPVSTREPVEGSEDESPADNEQHQTFCKEFCNMSYILNK